MHFGYRRKELSYIPLGHGDTSDCGSPADPVPTPTTAAGKYDCYGSVLATIDVVANVSDPQSTSEGVSQLFATGRTAELLAASDAATRAMFRAKLSLEAGLTPDQVTAAKKAAADMRLQTTSDIAAILAQVAPKNMFDQAALVKLVDATDTNPKDSWPALLKQKSTAGAVQSWLLNRPAIAHALASAIAKKS